jgi:hypothetical protein
VTGLNGMGKQDEDGKEEAGDSFNKLMEDIGTR